MGRKEDDLHRLEQGGVVAVVLDERPAPAHVLRSDNAEVVRQAITAHGGPLLPQKRS